MSYLCSRNSKEASEAGVKGDRQCANRERSGPDQMGSGSSTTLTSNMSGHWDRIITLCITALNSHYSSMRWELLLYLLSR